jgi:hypothetical protein
MSEQTSDVVIIPHVDGRAEWIGQTPTETIVTDTSVNLSDMT